MKFSDLEHSDSYFYLSFGVRNSNCVEVTRLGMSLGIIFHSSASFFSSFSGHSAFRHLMRDVLISKRHAFAEGTFSNLHTQFRSYFSYCVYFRRNPLPADVDTVCGYAQFLSRAMFIWSQDVALIFGTQLQIF